MLDTNHIVVKYMDGGVIQFSYDLDHQWLVENANLKTVFAWCKENLTDVDIRDGGYHMGDHTCYKYVHTSCDEDLMAFKLRWS